MLVKAACHLWGIDGIRKRRDYDVARRNCVALIPQGYVVNFHYLGSAVWDLKPIHREEFTDHG
jgi:hypothetical protein